MRSEREKIHYIPIAVLSSEEAEKIAAERYQKISQEMPKNKNFLDRLQNLMSPIIRRGKK